MALISPFSALLGSALGNTAYEIGKKGIREGIEKGLFSGVSKVGKQFSNFASGAKEAAASASAKRATEAAAARTTRWTSTFGKKGAENVTGLFDTIAKPVKRAMPGSADDLTGAAKKAQEKMIRKSTNNLFLGFRLNKPTQALIGAGIVTGLAINEGIKEVKSATYGNPYAGAMESAGDMPRMSGDMIGGVSNGRRDLGATGDLVLSLNRRR